MAKRVTRAEFRDMVKRAGGRVKAAEAMGVTPASVTHHLSSKKSLSLARVRMLQQVLGDLDEPAEITKEGRAKLLTLSVEELEKVTTSRWLEEEQGYQRKLDKNRVAAIESEIRSGNPKIPPIILGRLPDGSLIEIDGQHRRHGFMAAKAACQALVFNVADKEEARQLYLVYGGRVRPISSLDRYEASRNPLKLLLKGWEEEFKATPQQVKALARGLMGGKNVDFVAPETTMSPELVKRGRLVLELWTDDSRWSLDHTSNTSRKDSVYARTKLLQALGYLSLDYGLVEYKLVLEIIRGYRRTTEKGGKLWRTINEGKYRDAAEYIRGYVTPKMMGGLEKKTRGRRAKSG